MLSEGKPDVLTAVLAGLGIAYTLFASPTCRFGPMPSGEQLTFLDLRGQVLNVHLCAVVYNRIIQGCFVCLAERMLSPDHYWRFGASDPWFSLVSVV